MTPKVSRSTAEARGFQLTVVPEGDAFGIVLNEVKGKITPIANANRRRMRDLAAFTTLAIRASGHQRTVLHVGRKSPIPMREEAGVRLALGLLATEGVRKGNRKSRMLDALQGMAAEEAYYWYAKCFGREGARVRRALRLFLAED